MASPHQRNDDIEMVVEEEAVNGSVDREGREDEAEEKAAASARRRQGGDVVGSGESRRHAMREHGPLALVDSLRVSGRSSPRSFLPTLLGALDPHALLVCVVGSFLDMASTERDASKWWWERGVGVGRGDNDSDLGGWVGERTS